MKARRALKVNQTLQAMAAESLVLKRAKTRAFRARIKGDNAKTKAAEAACDASIAQIYEIARKGQVMTKLAGGVVMKALRDARDMLSAQEMDALADADAQSFLTLTAKPAPIAEIEIREMVVARPSATVIPFRPRKSA